MNMRQRIEMLESQVEDLKEELSVARKEALTNKSMFSKANDKAERLEVENKDLIRKVARAMGYIDALTDQEAPASGSPVDPYAPTPSVGPKIHEQI